MGFNFSPINRHAIRVSLTVVICAVICFAFHLPKPYWAMITILVVIQPNLGATLMRARHRSYATLVGVLVGAMLAIIIHQILWLAGIVGVICVFFTVFYLLRDYVKSIFFLSIVVMLVFSFQTNNIWHFVFARFFDTVLGVVLGFLASLLLWPITAKRMLQDDLLKGLRFAKDYVAMALTDVGDNGSGRRESLAKLRIQLSDTLELARKHYDEMEYEIDIAGINHSASHAMIASLEQIRATLFAMNSISNDRYPLPQEMIDYMAAFKEGLDRIFTFLVKLFEKEAQNSSAGLTLMPSRQLPQFPSCETSPQSLFLERNIMHLESAMNHLYQSARRFMLRDSEAINQSVTSRG